MESVGKRMMEGMEMQCNRKVEDIERKCEKEIGQGEREIEQGRVEELEKELRGIEQWKGRVKYLEEELAREYRNKVIADKSEAWRERGMRAIEEA